MPSPDGVLAAIDACLEDYTVGEDAMRWAPDEPDPDPAPGGGAPACLTSGWPILERVDGDTRWDGRRAEWEWQYTITGTDPAVVETWRQGQPWGAHLLTEEAAFVLESWQRAMVERIYQHGHTVTEWLETWLTFRSPQPLADTVFGIAPPEPAEDVPAHPPTLPSPVLPPVDGSHRVAFSESARHALGTAHRPPSGGVPESRRTRRRTP